MSIIIVVAAALMAPRTIDAAAARNARAATSASVAAHSSALAIGEFHEREIGSIETDVLELALGAASCAVKLGAVERPRTLTVIDYLETLFAETSLVYDLTTHELLYEELVAHGWGAAPTSRRVFQHARISSDQSWIVRDRRDVR